MKEEVAGYFNPQPLFLNPVIVGKSLSIMSGLDAAIVGSGPNGLAAALRLQQRGLSTAIFERASTYGGSARTEEPTLPGFKHDVGSGIHPLAYDSPFFKTLPLERYGLQWIYPEIAFAHPFDDGDAYACYRDIDATAAQFRPDDASRYKKIFYKLTEAWPDIEMDALGPLSFPGSPFKMARFGLKAILSAETFTKRLFREEKARAFFYGAAAHSALPLHYRASAAFGIVLNIMAHRNGWPFPQGGASKLTEALASYYRSLGGKIFLDFEVEAIHELPEAKVYLFDLTPAQLLKIKGLKFTSLYRKKLARYRYGAGVFKIDWALSEPIPFTNDKCRKAGTIHLGFTTEEIRQAEALAHENKTPEKPYVLLAQHTAFDATRAPEGKHTAWAYCHTPQGGDEDITEAIERQIERAAPGFKRTIVKRSARNARMMEAWNPNLVGGDINGGMQDIRQLFTRPVARLSPYPTPDPRVYICSSSTPPGGGVHGMCGYHAAEKALKDHFRDAAEEP